MFFKRNTLKNKMEETYKYWIDFVDKFEKSGNKETFLEQDCLVFPYKFADCEEVKLLSATKNSVCSEAAIAVENKVFTYAANKNITIELTGEYVIFFNNNQVKEDEKVQKIIKDIYDWRTK